MPSASIITITTPTDLVSGSPTTVDIDWDAETKYLDADVDFFDAGSDPRNLTIPASIDGEIYEVFLWVESSGVDWGGGDGIYMGIRGGPTGYESWGIIRDLGYPSRGIRTGPILAASGPVSWYSQVREFESHNFIPDSRCRFAVISGNPTPIAIAAGISSSYSTGSTEKNMNLAEEFDFGDVYNPTTGVYTAPAGASLAVCDCNGFISSATGGRVNYSLDLEGTEVARYEAGHALRGHGPGHFSVQAVSPGDEIVFRISDDSGTRTGQFSHSVEFF